MIAKQQNEMFALKKKLEANLNERLKVRETEHNKLLKRYQNVKREIEKQQETAGIKAPVQIHSQVDDEGILILPRDQINL